MAGQVVSQAAQVIYFEDHETFCLHRSQSILANNRSFSFEGLAVAFGAEDCEPCCATNRWV